MLKLFHKNRHTRPRPTRNTSNTPVFSALVTYYETPTQPPIVKKVQESNPLEFITTLTNTAFSILQEKGSPIPRQVLYELVTNLAHADFQEPVVTISADGLQLTVSDHGPGIPDKQAAVQPGYYGVTPSSYASFLRRTGAGLPLASRLMEEIGGKLLIDDNLSCGTVVTAVVTTQNKSSQPYHPSLRGAFTFTGSDVPPPSKENPPAQAGKEPGETEYHTLRTPVPPTGDEVKPTQLQTQGLAVAEALSDLRTKLSRRQRRVLFLVADLGQVGPSTAAAELDMSLSTAFRDLVTLEEMGLVQSDANGKRSLTATGARVITALTT